MSDENLDKFLELNNGILEVDGSCSPANIPFCYVAIVLFSVNIPIYSMADRIFRKYFIFSILEKKQFALANGGDRVWSIFWLVAVSQLPARSHSCIHLR